MLCPQPPLKRRGGTQVPAIQYTRGSMGLDVIASQRFCIITFLLSSAPGAHGCLAVLEELLSPVRYDPTIRPGVARRYANRSCTAPAAADEVITQFYVSKLSGIDEKRQSFDVDGYLRLWWRDDRLRHNLTCCEDPIKLPSACTKEPCNGDALRIWTPQLYIENAVSNLLGARDDGASISIYSDGRVFSSRRARITYDCSFQFQRLPFDVQWVPRIELVTVVSGQLHALSDRLRFARGHPDIARRSSVLIHTTPRRSGCTGLMNRAITAWTLEGPLSRASLQSRR